MELEPTPTVPMAPVHVEVCMKASSTARVAEIKAASEEFLQSVAVQGRLHHARKYVTFTGVARTLSPSTSTYLSDNLAYILVCEAGDVRMLRLHVFHLNDEEPAEEVTDDDEQITTSQQWTLPCREFDGLWESLHYDDCIKDRLLQFTTTSLLFADRGVDTNVISCNRVVLLHGPPGTGKTSLCKALAQKLAIRFGERYTRTRSQCCYPNAVLVEVNAHSLFSKWFSESGKLVMKLFQGIRDLLDDNESFVCVLIDEVESLTAARQSAMSGNDPSDAIRVVNALLTQLDQLRHYKNVMILTTSNITGTIDLAFVDRADIKQFIGLPGIRARYEVLASCLHELSRLAIIQANESVLEWSSLELLRDAGPSSATRTSLRLRSICEQCQGFSGRALRKMPFLAHAMFLSHASTSATLEQFLDALQQALQFEEASRASLTGQ